MRVLPSLLLACVLVAFAAPSAFGIEVNCDNPRSRSVQLAAPRQDLKGYWPFSGDFRDYSGNEKHLGIPLHAKLARPTLMESGGPQGRGYVKFSNDGSKSSPVEMLVVEDYDPVVDGSYTFEFWFKVDNDYDSYPSWFLSYSVDPQSNDLGHNEFWMSTGWGDKPKDRCDAGKSGEVTGTTGTDSDCGASSNWKHLAYVVDSSVGRVGTLYLNGEQIATKTNVKNVRKSGLLAFGQELDDHVAPYFKEANQALDGGMAEVRHWGRALSQNEIREFMNATYTCGTYDNGTPCTDEEDALCHPLAYCEKVEQDNAFKPKCFCPAGLYGEGFGPLGCHMEVPSLTCEPAGPNVGNTSGSSPARRSGLIIGGPSKLAGYWPLSKPTLFADKSGMGHDMTVLNDGPTLNDADLSSPFRDGYADFEPTARTKSDIQGLFVKEFDTQLAGTDGSYTWEFWMRVDEDPSTTEMWFISYAIGDRDDGQLLDNNFFMSTGHQAAGKCDGGRHGEVKGSSAVCAEGGPWRHVAFVHDGPNEKGTLYVDGVEQNRKTYKQGAMGTGGTLMFGGELDGLDPVTETRDIREPSQFLNGKMTEVRYWTEARSQEQIITYKDFRLLSLQCSDYASGALCDEDQSNTCYHSANCESIDGNATCFCEMGMIGDGYGSNGCRTKGWTVRTVYEEVTAINLAWLSDPAARETWVENFKTCFEADAVHFQRGVAPFSDAIHFPYASHSLMVNALYDTEPDAAKMKRLQANASGCFVFGTVGSTGTRMYPWNFDSTADEIQVQPTGLTIDSVTFETSCADSGCWVIDVTYTTGGKDAFNSFYLPQAVGNDTISYDFEYDANTMNTFLPKNFPCRTHEYIRPDGSVPASLPDQVTTCCLLENYTAISSSDTANGFIMDYRPTEAFTDWVDEMRPYLCQGRDFPYVTVLDRADYNESEANPSSFIDVNFPWHSTVPHRFLDGKFKDMPVSPGVVSTTTLDPFFYQYRATIKLDEVELRQLAGQLKGTVGVEHTVDTFLGFVNFRPTGLPVLDAFATQVNIHLEKTSFFSVSTHGENAYTFLEYVNMRLISIYNEDADFSGLDEASNRTIRTDSSGNANYVQVTFTMGAQYAPNPLSGGLIPMDSVRAGRGTFFGQTTLEHLCSMYTEGNATAGDDIGLSTFADDIAVFDAMLDQDCGPQSSMCVSPESVPDQFVSFNIPLGFEVFDGQASNSLENNIFVSMVINARDGTGCTNPNTGCDPLQVKTTLEASIPIVAGGINIFCDGVTAKTDLKDVANADIVVGSAANATELTRLRIVEDIANTNLGAVPSTQIDTDSIEAGLMTLVLKGKSSYFENGVVNSQGYSLELDDLITLHLMTNGEAPQETSEQCANAARPKSVDCQLRDLLSEPAEDNLDSNGLDTDGYKLNGAFKFNVARGDGIAKLEPTDALLAICPFNPTRPAGGLPLESCITRRDVRTRTYPVRNGAPGPTAMELLAQTGLLTDDDVSDEIAKLETQVSPNQCTCDGTEPKRCCEPGFLQMILGENDYARDLAVAYVKTLHERYTLNGRYMRAYWINPGYEWTPTQTAGKSIFSVSQKLYLFALITLDENISRRRMLLATDVNPAKDTGSGAGGAQLSFPVARTSIMAQAYDVPAEKAVVFNVEMQLTQAEACMSDEKFVEQARLTFLDYADTAASAFHTVQVLGFSRSLNGVSCRRALRKMLSDFSAATASVQMMIVFHDKQEAVFNDAMFADMAGISSVTADASTAGNVRVDATYKNQVPNSKTTSEDSDSSSSNTALIAGVAGGVGGAVVLLAGAMLFMRSRNQEQQPVVQAVQTINLSDLKAQLTDEV